MKTALVVGCSAGVWHDVDAAQKLTKFDAVYCVKIAGIYWPSKFLVWVGLHPEYQAEYSEQRRTLGYPDGYETVGPLLGETGHKDHVDRRVSYRWPGMNASASSGIYGAKVALDDGYDRIVLAGVPMQADQKHFTRGKAWTQCDAFLRGLHESVPHLLGKVKSMSGLTRDLLGWPTPEWLSGDPQ